MNFVVYILYSRSINKYYIGQTEDFEARFKLHLDKTLVGNFTKRASDWELFYSIDCHSRTQAVAIEAYDSVFLPISIGQVVQHESIEHRTFLF